GGRAASAGEACPSARVFRRAAPGDWMSAPQERGLRDRQADDTGQPGVGGDRAVLRAPAGERARGGAVRGKRPPPAGGGPRQRRVPRAGGPPPRPWAPGGHARRVGTAQGGSWRDLHEPRVRGGRTHLLTTPEPQSQRLGEQVGPVLEAVPVVELMCRLA